jgi:hypothetical protein
VLCDSDSAYYSIGYLPYQTVHSGKWLMQMISRRSALGKFAVISVGSAIMIIDRPSGAEASFFSKLVGFTKNVGSTAIQGVSAAVHAVPQLVKTGVAELNHGITVTANTINALSVESQLVAQTFSQIVPQLGQLASNSFDSLISQASQLAQAGIAQGTPLFFNASSQDANLSYYWDQASAPMALSSTDESSFQGDPYTYLKNNSQTLDQFVTSSGPDRQVQTLTVPSYQADPKSAYSLLNIGTPTSQGGYYPMRMGCMDENGAPLFSLLTMFLAAMG